MIRYATADDKKALIAVAQVTGLFSEEELAAFGDMMREQLEGEDNSDHVWIADEEDALVGAAYYTPEVFAEGVWNLYFIGVHPSEQGKGRGSGLIRYVEADLKQRGVRLLLVETSGTDDFERSRRFYQKNGFSPEARIRDYYQPGDDKIIFRKVLSAR